MRTGYISLLYIYYLYNNFSIFIHNHSIIDLKSFFLNLIFKIILNIKLFTKKLLLHY